MYTIVINNDKSLTTSVKSTILRNTTTDEVQFLYLPPEVEENSTVIYSAIMKYETDHILKSESLVTDEQLYKERVRFYIPRSSAFFSNRGIIKLWLIITMEVFPTEGDPEVEEFTTLPTTMFIEEVPYEGKHYSNNVIRITRGDSLTVNVTLTDNDGFIYEPVEGDQVWFTVKKSAIAEDVLIRKSIDIHSLVLDLVEADTEDLAFGEYKYEIEVITTQDDHYTVIKNAPFIIMEELH